LSEKYKGFEVLVVYDPQHKKWKWSVFKETTLTIFYEGETTSIEQGSKQARKTVDELT
jgi:hypothetical protein